MPIAQSLFPLRDWLRRLLRTGLICAGVAGLAGPLDAAEPEDDVPLTSSFLQDVPPAPGADPSGVPDLMTQQRLSDLEARLNSLATAVESGGLVPGRARSTDIAPPSATPPTATFPKIKLTGFFQLDAGFFNQDAASLQNFAYPGFPDPPVNSSGNIQDDTGFRRARLAAVGDVSENVSYMIEMDFAFPGRPSFMDVWLDVHEVPLFGNVRVGQWRQPFGMDNLTSVRELTFLERGLNFAFTPFRQTGVGFHDNNAEQSATWAGSVFAYPVDQWGGRSGDSGYGTAGRVTWLPIYENDGNFLVHVGGDHALLMPGDTQIRFRNVPEFGGPFIPSGGTAGSVPFFVDTGLFSANSVNLVNGELAGVWNSFHAQSELTYAAVNPVGGGTTVFSAFSAQAAYLLTGEVRPYNKVAGVLGRIKPNCPIGSGGIGAWEVAARYSYLDLNDGSFAGGKLSDVTLGLNWYLNSYTKFQLNYIRAMLNHPPVGDSTTNILAVRAQLDF